MKIKLEFKFVHLVWIVSWFSKICTWILAPRIPNLFLWFPNWFKSQLYLILNATRFRTRLKIDQDQKWIPHCCWIWNEEWNESCFRSKPDYDLLWLHDFLFDSTRDMFSILPFPFTMSTHMWASSVFGLPGSPSTSTDLLIWVDWKTKILKLGSSSLGVLFSLVHRWSPNENLFLHQICKSVILSWRWGDLHWVCSKRGEREKEREKRKKKVDWDSMFGMNYQTSREVVRYLWSRESWESGLGCALKFEQQTTH